MASKTIAILGGGGFLGTHLCNQLIADGYEVRVLCRHPYHHRHLLVLPGLTMHAVDAGNLPLLTKALKGCDAVINLVGILNESGMHGKGFVYSHVTITDHVLHACKNLAIRRYLHVSALGANASKGTSHYLRTKGEAEARVLQAEHLDATIFKPSVMFGPGDSFTERLLRLATFSPGVFLLPCGYSLLAPIHVYDVVQVITQTLSGQQHMGQCYELAGPEIFRLSDVARLCLHYGKKRRWVISLGPKTSWFLAKILERLPGKPFSTDNYRSAHEGNTGICCLEHFNILPTSLSAYLSQQAKQTFTNTQQQRLKEAGRQPDVAST